MMEWTPSCREEEMCHQTRSAALALIALLVIGLTDLLALRTLAAEQPERRQQEIVEKVKQLTRAVEQSPKDPEAWLARALLCVDRPF